MSGVEQSTDRTLYEFIEPTRATNTANDFQFRGQLYDRLAQTESLPKRRSNKGIIFLVVGVPPKPSGTGTEYEIVFRCAVRVAIISALLRVGFCLLSQTVHFKILSLCLICVANKQHHRFSFAGIVSMSIFWGLSHECPDFFLSFFLLCLVQWFPSVVNTCRFQRTENERVPCTHARTQPHTEPQRETNTHARFLIICVVAPSV